MRPSKRLVYGLLLLGRKMKTIRKLLKLFYRAFYAVILPIHLCFHLWICKDNEGVYSFESVQFSIFVLSLHVTKFTHKPQNNSNMAHENKNSDANRVHNGWLGRKARRQHGSPSV